MLLTGIETQILVPPIYKGPFDPVQLFQRDHGVSIRPETSRVRGERKTGSLVESLFYEICKISKGFGRLFLFFRLVKILLKLQYK